MSITSPDQGMRRMGTEAFPLRIAESSHPPHSRNWLAEALPIFLVPPRKIGCPDRRSQVETSLYGHAPKSVARGISMSPHTIPMTRRLAGTRFMPRNPTVVKQ